MINNVVLMGRLTAEPELKVTTSGLNVINFQLAVDRAYKADNAERQTDFISCRAWRKTAEFIDKYFHKGDMLALTGSIQTENYTDKDGNKRKATVVSVNEVSFCGSKKDSATNFAFKQPSYTTDNSDIEVIDDDDLPF